VITLSHYHCIFYFQVLSSIPEGVESGDEDDGEEEEEIEVEMDDDEVSNPTFVGDCTEKAWPFYIMGYFFYYYKTVQLFWFNRLEKLLKFILGQQRNTTATAATTATTSSTPSTA